MRKALTSLGLTLVVLISLLALVHPADATVRSDVTASSVDGCPDSGYICFYNYESFNSAGGIYVQFSGPANTCHVLPTSGIAGWTNGKVYNATTSILYNWTGPNTVARTIYFYDNNTCTSTNFVQTTFPGQLNTEDWRLANIGWNDRIGSWKLQ